MKNNDINLEKVISEIENLMEETNNGLLRNSVVNTVADYLNNLQNLYLFQEKYKVTYSTTERHVPDYSKIQNGYTTLEEEFENE